MVEITISFFEPKKMDTGEKYSITVFKKIKEETIRKRKIKKDPIDEIIELLSEIKERYSKEKGKLIAIDIRSKDVLTRGAIIVGENQEDKNIILFPDIVKINKITIYKRNNDSYSPISEWKPEKEYYIFYTSIDNIPEDELILVDTDKGSRIIGPEDTKLASRRTKTSTTSEPRKTLSRRRKKTGRRRKRKAA